MAHQCILCEPNQLISGSLWLSFIEAILFCSKRMNIYKFMLDHMTDENKFNLTAKLSNDVSVTTVRGEP